MIKYIYNKVSALKHIVAALFLVAAGTANANEIQIDRIFIDNGETQTVNVNFEKTSTVVALQVYFTFPAGISYNDGTITRNADRLDRDSHGLQSNLVTNTDGSKTLRVAITPNNGDDEIQGTSGTLFSFQITAESNIDAAVIKVTKIEVSEILTNDEGQRKLQALQLKDFDVEVSSKTSIRILEVSPASMTIEEGEANNQKVTIGLTNGFDIYGMQGTIVLPEGMSIETKENGKPKFSYGSRLPEAFSISSNVVDNKVKFVVSARESAKFGGNEGKVLSFNVYADNTLAETSQILIEDGVVSNSSAKSLALDAKTIEVINKTAADRRISNEAYAVLDAQLKAVQEKYTAAVDSIAAFATQEGQVYADSEDAKAIAEALSAARESLDAANAAFELKSTDELSAEYTTIDKQVDALLAAAVTADNAAKQVNNDAYAALDAQLKGVQDKYNTAIDSIKGYITAEGKAYAESEEATAIADSLASARTILDAANAAYALRSTDEKAAEYAALNSHVDSLAEAAKSAEDAAIAKNAEIYATIDAQLKAVEEQYDSLLNVIKAYTTDEAKALAEGENAKAIADSLAAVRTAIDSANEAMTLRDSEAYATQLAGQTDSISALADLAAQTEEEYKIVKGDVNEDKSVDVTDASILIDYILEKEVEVFNEKAADMDENGEYDVTDVLMIIDLILSEANDK